MKEKFQLLSETPFHKHCEVCWGRMERYAIWNEDQFWETIEFCKFCSDVDNDMLYGGITDDLDPNYTNDYIGMEEEMDTNLRW